MTESISLLALPILALTIEAIVKTLTEPPATRAAQIKYYSVIVLSVVTALATGFDAFTLAGVALPYPFVGMALTGIVLARGANGVHQLFGRKPATTITADTAAGVEVRTT